MMKIVVGGTLVEGEDFYGFFLSMEELKIVKNKEFSKRVRVISNYRPKSIELSESCQAEDDPEYLEKLGENIEGSRLHIIDTIKNNGIPVREITLLHRLRVKSFAK